MAGLAAQASAVTAEAAAEAMAAAEAEAEAMAAAEALVVVVARAILFPAAATAAKASPTLNFMQIWGCEYVSN